MLYNIILFQHTTSYPLRDPKYHIIETIRPLTEVHWWGVVGCTTEETQRSVASALVGFWTSRTHSGRLIWNLKRDLWKEESNL